MAAAFGSEMAVDLITILGDSDSKPMGAVRDIFAGVQDKSCRVLVRAGHAASDCCSSAHTRDSAAHASVVQYSSRFPTKSCVGLTAFHKCIFLPRILLLRFLRILFPESFPPNQASC